MREHSLKKLEYPRIVDTLTGYTSTYAGRRLAEEIRPMTDVAVITRRLQETEEARSLLSRGGHPPLPLLEGMETIMALLGTGYVLSEQQFGHLAQFARSCGQLRQYMASKRADAPNVAGYAASMHDLGKLKTAIEECVDRGSIVDSASAELHKIRKKLRTVEERLHKRLEGLLSKHAAILQERLVSQRNGRYVLPVKKEFRKRISGVVLDESASGQTVFLEPSELAELQMELSGLRAEEHREELQILAQLSGVAESYSHELSVNVETAAHYDFLFAKAKWALAIGATAVEMNDEGVIRLHQARHPFLPGKPVPLSLEIGTGYRSLLVTGPNTGGKTVSLKTVGILTLMAQSGLLIPAGEGSRLAVFRSVEADIGDDQSLDASLSTFSAHMRNVIDILGVAGSGTLVLLDELATGTDPGEGVGLSIAVLEELYRRGCLVMATTHFNEIKEYARVTPGFRNARMAFDEDTLQPLYRLDMGEAGNSYAFVIAAKLGIPPGIVDRARVIAHTLKQGRPTSAEGIPAAIAEGQPHPHASQPKEQRSRAEREPGQLPNFEVGDVVFIPQLKKTGVIYRLPDERGNLIVQVQKEKLTLNHKRVRPYIERKNLYPGEDYDMDIVFESVENRKKRKLMSKRHVPGLTIEKPEEDENNDD
ncbi:DNA mismatch repair protein MutS [Cohnella pontilimi]|uniref:DNA mismatch repair protein MutS n=1 Tax=Cohnella pontilimi TaxID=2564100 RepID=A0A4U0FF55_9BACL|nr:DNA mismatch repair protein MutS [Cohnella pontilimi]TJY43471.1 DNA mismatch repair protein MutS [Cohnella pontilimi]